MKNFTIIIFFLTFQTFVFAQINLRNGLIGCYSFSGDASDGTGNSNNGTTNGATLTTDRFGKSNSAFQFNGFSDYIALPVSPYLNNNYTYSLWARPASIPPSGNKYALLSVGGTGGDQGIDLANNYVGFLGWAGGGYNNPSVAVGAQSGSLPSVNTWVHIVATRDNDNIRLYINGNFVSTVSTLNSLPFYGSATGAIIGGRSTTAGFFYQGAIDDVSIYNRALSDAEVAALFDTFTCETVDLQNGLIACYPFSGNANDSRGTNNGTVNGATSVPDRSGNPGNAYSFNGTSNFISIPSTGFLNNNYTYSAWVNAASIPDIDKGTQVLSLGGLGADQNLQLGNSTPGNGGIGWTVFSYATNGNVYVTSVGTLPNLNIWYHLVSVRDNNTIKQYINGQLVGSASTGGLLPGYGSDPAFNIGRRSHLAGNPINSYQYFNGSIDDVAIYNRPLNPLEVSELYTVGLPCTAVPPPVAQNVVRCGTGTVTFTASGGTAYRWYDALSGGNLLFSGNPFVTASLSATTTFYVANVVNGSESARVAATATVNPLPAKPVISVSGSKFCAGEQVTLGVSGSGFTYTWSNGVVAPSITVTLGTGSYTVKATDANGCVSPDSDPFSAVAPQPVVPLVQLTANTGGICAGNAVTFTAIPVNGGTTPLYQWRIAGVNQGSLTTNPVFTATINQNTTVEVSMTSQATCTTPAVVTASRAVTVVNGQPLTVSIKPERDSVCAGESLRYRAFPGGTIFSAKPVYQWKLDGVNQGKADTVSSFSLTTDINQTNDLIAKVSVEMTAATCTGTGTVSSPAYPVKILSRSKVSIRFPAEVEIGKSYTYQAIVSGGKPPYTYEWNFGDSTALVITTQPFSDHIYKNEKTYPVSVRVTNGGGCSTLFSSPQTTVYKFCNFATLLDKTSQVTFSPAYPGDEPFEMLIYDTVGKLIFKTNRGTDPWLLPRVSDGLYLYRIRIGSKECKGKLVVQ
jgi:hypothetical protein